MKTANGFVAILLMAGVSFFTACDSSPKEEKKDSKEVAEDQNKEKFTKDSTEKNAQLLVDIAAANYHEIAMASVAGEKSTNKGLKTLADSLAADHKAVLSDVQALAANKSVSLPQAEAEDAMKTTEKFKTKSNADFNKDWTDEMISMHKKSISKFEDAVNSNTTAPDTKAWASATLPKLNMHLQMLEKLQGELAKK